MKKPVTQILIAVGFVGYLAVMLLGTLLPKPEFSPLEKRYLAEFPEPDWQSVTSGEWGDALESWLADHVFLRNFFVGLDAYKERLLGQPGEIRVVEGRLVEAPVTVDEADLEKKLATLRAFSDTVGGNVTLALVPSAGWATGREEWKDDEMISGICQRAGVENLNLTSVFENRPELFYRTDHHWTSRGAYEAYRAIAGYFGREIQEEFSVETIPACFRGSTYSRSALWLTPAEDMELWQGSGDITCTIPEEDAPKPVFARSRLTEADPYTVFLDGNHPLVRLNNPNASGKLLVIRDSYSNCLGPFLAESWGQVVMVDLRYYRQSVSALAREGFDQILVLYSLSNFLTDPNLILLR